jgi:hypothetical protein
MASDAEPIQSGDFASAARAIAQRTPLAREQVAGASDETVKRIAKGTIAYYDGMLAARQGDSMVAKAKADELRRVLARSHRSTSIRRTLHSRAARLRSACTRSIAFGRCERASLRWPVLLTPAIARVVS